MYRARSTQRSAGARTSTVVREWREFGDGARVKQPDREDVRNGRLVPCVRERDECSLALAPPDRPVLYDGAQADVNTLHWYNRAPWDAYMQRGGVSDPDTRATLGPYTTHRLRDVYVYARGTPWDPPPSVMLPELPLSGVMRSSGAMQLLADGFVMDLDDAAAALGPDSVDFGVLLDIACGNPPPQGVARPLLLGNRYDHDTALARSLIQGALGPTGANVPLAWAGGGFRIADNELFFELRAPAGTRRVDVLRVDAARFAALAI